MTDTFENLRPSQMKMSEGDDMKQQPKSFPEHKTKFVIKKSDGEYPSYLKKTLP